MKYYIEPLDKSHVPLFDDFKAYEDETMPFGGIASSLFRKF